MVQAAAERSGGELHDSGLRRGLFYGWIIAAVAALGLASGISVFLPSTIGLLIAPLGREFGWSPPQVLTALTLNTLATLVAAPMTGKLVDRFGVRRVILPAFICEALLIGSFYFQSANIASFYVRYVLFALLGTGTTAISYSALISRWFDRRRGLALGITLAGVGMGGVVWSIMSQHLFDTVGWRSTMLYAAAVILLAILPIQMVFVRDDPAAMGLDKDGDRPNHDVSAAEAARPVEGRTLREAIGMGRFWLVLLIFFLTTFGTYGVTLNLVTILTRQGVSPQLAASVQATIWLAMLFGRVSTGWFLDRFFAPYVAIAFVIPAIAGTAMLAAGGTDGFTSFAAAMLIGLAAGAEIDVVAYLVGRYFGLRHFGAVYSMNFSVLALATSVGPLVGATVAAANGGRYGISLVIMAMALTLAAVLLLFCPRYPTSVAARR